MYAPVFFVGGGSFWLIKPVSAQNWALTGSVVFWCGYVVRKPLSVRQRAYVPPVSVLTPPCIYLDFTHQININISLLNIP